LQYASFDLFRLRKHLGYPVLVWKAECMKRLAQHYRLGMSNLWSVQKPTL
jgi:hypothetical protein